jgi:transcriptional regulator with XRE-family HTH domain
VDRVLQSYGKSHRIGAMDAKATIAELMGAGLTQTEIARRTGIDQSTVSGIYTGRRGKRISYEVMQKLKSLLVDVRERAGDTVAKEGA